MGDFVHDVSFKYSIPLIALDFIDAMTGSELLKDLHKAFFPKKIICRFNGEDPEFLELRHSVDKITLSYVFSIFDKLSVLSKEELQSFTDYEKETH